MIYLRYWLSVDFALILEVDFITQLQMIMLDIKRKFPLNIYPSNKVTGCLSVCPKDLADR